METVQFRCLHASLCGFRCCSHWLGGTGIINSGAGCIYFKTLLRVCTGADGISLQSEQGGTVWPRAQNSAVMEKQWTSSFSKGDKEDQMCFLSPVMCSTESKHWSVWAAHPCRSAANVQPLVSFSAALGWINNFMQAKLQLSVYDSEHSFILGRESYRVCMAVFLSGSYI